MPNPQLHLHGLDILVLTKEVAPFAPVVLTLLALSPVGLLASLDDCRALTVRVLYRDVNHSLPPQERCHVRLSYSKTTDLEHYPAGLSSQTPGE